MNRQGTLILPCDGVLTKNQLGNSQYITDQFINKQVTEIDLMVKGNVKELIRYASVLSRYHKIMLGYVV